MTTPVVTAHRNLRQRISKLLDSADAKALTPWQLEVIRRALADLEFGLFPEGEVTMSRAERPDLHEPAGYMPESPATLDELRLRLEAAASP